ncbi:hypothetical protein [Azospirillum sp. sgz302134]
MTVHQHLSDDDILGRKLEIDDPHAEFDLLEQGEVPKDAVMAAIVASYRVPEKIQCSKPSCGVPHNWGFVVRLADGRHIVVGNVCGRQLFPDTWDTLESSHKYDVRRQQLIRRKREFLADYPRIAAVLRTLRAPFSAVTAARKKWRTDMHALYLQLETAARRDGSVLKVAVRGSGSTMSEAIREIERDIGRRGRSSIADDRMETVHVLAGTEFFVGGDPRRMVEAALETLDDMARALAAPNQTNTVMERQLRRRDDVRKLVGDAMDIYRACAPAMSPDNFAGIALWTERLGSLSGRYAMSKDGQRLTMVTDRADRYEIAAPRLPIVDEAALAALWEGPASGEKAAA